MKNYNPKLLAREKFIEIREKELKKNQSKIFLQVEKFIRKYIEAYPLKKKQYIGIYWPLKGEVDLRDLKNSFDIQFLLPCCKNKGQIEYKKWSGKNLQNDYCGIPSPLNEKTISPDEISVLFLPALAIDLNGNRLGYGGGYYDRLRKNSTWRSIITFVVLPEKCVSLTPLPCDPWDIPFESWITEKGPSKIKKTTPT
tara:strand:+ start:66 stop:656 length:591 start_codon:yes stop_codon:yes gene_type:complete